MKQVASKRYSVNLTSYRTSTQPTLTFIEFKKEDIEQSIPNRFEQQVNRYPNRIAIKTKTQQITYEQLNRMANRLAYAIRSQLGKGEEPIILLLEKGASLIATMLGVLKVGKIYVPLDTSFPKFRLTYMLDDSQAVLIITNNKNIALASELAQGDCQLLNIDDIQYSNLSTENLGLLISPDTLAYIIYTSGSTGQPKGIAHNHRNTLHNIRTTTNAFHIGPNDRMTFLHASGVMSAVRGIFSTLLNGATLYPIDVNNTKLSDLNNLLSQEEITVYYSVPTLFRTIVSSLTGAEEFPKLRLVILTGEPVLMRDVELYKKYFSPNCILGTGLGTSETGTVRVCSIDKDTDINNSTAPLGYAVDDIEIMLLDDAGAEVDTGNIGEIAVKSRYIAQGYWQNLTKAAFKPAGENEYIYRTGDMGHMLPDGCLIHHGRKDFQVKIRGYRVELSEIEMALQQHPMIKNVVVMAVGESTKDKQLVAYFVRRQSPEENYTHTKDIILDPLERIEFKLKQPGLRHISEEYPSVTLFKPDFDETLTQTYLERQSYRQFLAEPISFEQLSLLLSSLLPINLEDTPLPKYRYPSAHGLYPVQTYLFIKSNLVEGLEGGIYYYFPPEHRLILLQAGEKVEKIVSGEYCGYNQRTFEQSAFALFLIGQLNAITPLYGDLSRDYCFLEAGYMGQLLMEMAPNHQIGLCPIGNLEFEKCRELLCLESNHLFLHSFVGGKIAQAQTKQWLVQEAMPNTLRRFLQDKLPDYMVPSAFVRLDTMPLTPNGKVDRRALPVPDQARSDFVNPFIAPRTPVEEKLASIWSEVLHREPVGIYDNFFDLGGHSLLATQVMSRLHDAFQMELPLRIMFEKPTVANFAEHIETIRWAVQTSHPSTINEEGEL